MALSYNRVVCFPVIANIKQRAHVETHNLVT